MAVKIRLKRLGKIRVPQYRIVVVDSRKKRDGKVIEEIGKYHPKEDPCYIEVVSERAQYWLGVGAQPTEAVAKILKITGDWQTFKGIAGTEGTLKVAEPKRAKIDIFNEALKEAGDEPKADAAADEEEGRQAAEEKADKPAEEAAAEARRRGDPRGRDPGCRGTGRARLRAAEASPSRRRPKAERLMLADALEHLVRGCRRQPRRRRRARQAAASRLDPRGPGPPRRPRQGDRSGRTHRDRLPHRRLAPWPAESGARIDFVDVDRRR